MRKKHKVTVEVGRWVFFAGRLMMRALAVTATTTLAQGVSQAEAPARPWMNRALPTERRVALLLGAMTPTEKQLILLGYWPDRLAEIPDAVLPPAERARYLAAAVPGSAGYVPGVERLGIPPQYETDASLGVRNANLERTGLPSSLATAASWDPAISEAGGRMIGDEARRSGFNVMLAGGVNLVREARNGRNFEYTGEDPLLAGTMAAGLVRGVQSNGIVSTVKHFAINSQETGRFVVSSQIGEAAARTSDYLAFEFAIEKSSPGSVMCSYNRINDVYACENAALLTDVLRRDWGYKGYVMSDWGAVHSTVQAANAGLDQQSGYPFDKSPFFRSMLTDALADGSISPARLDQMAGRVLWAMFDKGVMDAPRRIEAIDFAAHAKVTQAAAEASIVLLKNERNLLPLAATRTIAMIGSFAEHGVLAGGGSSLVTPVGGNAVAGLEPSVWPGPMMWHPSSPVAEVRALRPDAQVRYESGFDIARAVATAKASEVAIVFVHQWVGESFDAASLSLSGNQDALVAAVAAANPNTIVVVESGGAIAMPWVDAVPAIVEAWYPATRGGAAIARVLTGAVNPSGHLPITFPAYEAQLPRPALDGKGLPPEQPFTVRYAEGAAVGYKWHDVKALRPLFAFGHGLSYTRFEFSDARATAGKQKLGISFSVTNRGPREGAAVAQVYVAPRAGGWEAPRRLGAFGKIALDPGQTSTVRLSVDPRLLATFDPRTREWVIAAGRYELQLAAASDDVRRRVEVTLPAARFSAATHTDTRRTSILD